MIYSLRHNVVYQTKSGTHVVMKWEDEKGWVGYLQNKADVTQFVSYMKMKHRVSLVLHEEPMRYNTTYNDNGVPIGQDSAVKSALILVDTCFVSYEDAVELAETVK